jgi:hypothetical protein
MDKTGRVRRIATMENCHHGELPLYSPSHPQIVHFKIKIKNKKYKYLNNAVLIKSPPGVNDEKKRFETL